MTDSPPDSDASDRLVWAERLRAIEKFEAHLVRQSVVPDAEKLLVRRLAVILQVLVAGAIGFFVAVATVLLNFILFTKILHA